MLFWLGQLFNKTGEYDKAETTLHDAAKAAGQSRDALLAAKSMARLVWVVGYQQARFDAGSSIASNAEVMLAVAEGDEQVRALLYKNLGVMFYRKGDYDSALERIRISLELSLNALGPTHPLVSASYNNIGEIYRKIGDYDRALHYLRESLVIDTRA